MSHTSEKTSIVAVRTGLATSVRRLTICIARTPYIEDTTSQTCVDRRLLRDAEDCRLASDAVL